MPTRVSRTSCARRRRDAAEPAADAPSALAGARREALNSRDSPTADRNCEVDHCGALWIFAAAEIAMQMTCPCGSGDIPVHTGRRGETGGAIAPTSIRLKGAGRRADRAMTPGRDARADVREDPSRPAELGDTAI